MLIARGDPKIDKSAPNVNQVLKTSGLTGSEPQMYKKPGTGFISKFINSGFTFKNEGDVLFVFGHGSQTGEVVLDSSENSLLHVRAKGFIEKLNEIGVNFDQYKCVVILSCFTGCSGFGQELSCLIDKPVLAPNFRLAAGTKQSVTDIYLYLQLVYRENDYIDSQSKSVFSLIFPSDWPIEKMQEYYNSIRSNIRTLFKNTGGNTIEELNMFFSIKLPNGVKISEKEFLNLPGQQNKPDEILHSQPTRRHSL